MSNCYNKIFDKNALSIKKQIELKNGNEPYYVTKNDYFITDMDHFPYKRFHRGVNNFSKPIVFERNAGWRSRRDYLYKEYKSTDKNSYPNHHFQSACSTVVPCFQEVTNDDLNLFI